jgi:hypothetical protein
MKFLTGSRDQLREHAHATAIPEANDGTEPTQCPDLAFKLEFDDRDLCGVGGT